MCSSDLVEAEPLFQQTLSLRERALGPDHESVAATLDSLFTLYMLRGDAARAYDALHRAAEITERTLRRNLVAGSERRKLAFLDQHSRDISKAISLHARLSPNDPRTLDLALTLLLRFKGRTLDVMADSIARLRRRVDSLTRTRYQLGSELEQLRGSASNSQQASANATPDDEPVQLTRAELKQLIDKQIGRAHV